MVSRIGWALVGAACGALSMMAALYAYLKPQAQASGLSSRCLDCGVRYSYAHPSMQLQALGFHQVRCPGLAS